MAKEKKLGQVIRKLFFVGAGGSGKSTFFMLLAAIAAWKKLVVDLYDCDPANPTAQRYHKEMPQDSILWDDAQESFEQFMEEQVWTSKNRCALVDYGANMEGLLGRWKEDRGDAFVEQMRFLVFISKRDALTAADRIIEIAKGAPVLLVINSHGGKDAENAAKDELYLELLGKPGVESLTVPRLGRTMSQIHQTSITPDRMLELESCNAFDRQGALNLLRKIDLLFEPHPQFRPW